MSILDWFRAKKSSGASVPGKTMVNTSPATPIHDRPGHEVGGKEDELIRQFEVWNGPGQATKSSHFLKQLSQIGSSQARQYLVNVLTDPKCDDSTRVHAAGYLGDKKFSGAVDKLIEIVADNQKDITLRCYLARALGK